MSHPMSPFPLRRMAQAVLLAALSMGAGATLAQSPAEARRHVEIAAGTLDGALNRFASSTGILLAIDGKLTAGKTSSGLKGDYTAQQARWTSTPNTRLFCASRASSWTAGIACCAP